MKLPLFFFSLFHTILSKNLALFQNDSEIGLLSDSLMPQLTEFSVVVNHGEAVFDCKHPSSLFSQDKTLVFVSNIHSSFNQRTVVSYGFDI